MSIDHSSEFNVHSMNRNPLGFYIASSDQDMLVHVSRLVNRCGCVGMMDTAGRVQYLVDGRRGSPYAARRIEETTDKLFVRDERQKDVFMDYVFEAVEQILSDAGIGNHLKGCRYIRFMLQAAAQDPTSLRPISKTLYPETASRFKVSASQIERDLRYAIKSSSQPELAALSNTAAICRLHDLVNLRARHLLRKQSEPS